MLPKHVLYAVLFLLSILAAQASEFGAKNVVKLTSTNFKDKTGDGKLWFIKFYAPWCGHCKKLAPTWKELGDAYADNADINIAHVDCVADKSTCKAAEVKGYPTLKLYHGGQTYDVYKGPRDKNSLQNAVDKAATALLSETVS